MLSRRGSTLTELVIVMAVVEIMAVMVISFTTIVSSWSSLGTRRVNTVQSSELLSGVFHTFVSDYDNSMYQFVLQNETENDNEQTYAVKTLRVKKISDQSDVAALVYKEKDNTLTLTKAGDADSRLIPLEGITGIGFRILGNSSDLSVLVCADVEYVYVTPGRSNPEENRSYTLVASLRSGH